MPQTQLHDGAAVRLARDVEYHDGSVARTACRQGWFHDGTVPRLVFEAAAAPAPTFTVGGGFTFRSTTDNSVYVQGINPDVRFRSDGTVLSSQPDNSISAESINGGGMWGSPITPAIGANFWIKAELADGNAPISSAGAGSAAIGVWIRLIGPADVQWYIASGGGNLRFRNLTYAIATDGAGSSLVGSGSIRLLYEKVVDYY